jgi:tRNA-modifying protein YgfZ
MTEGYNALCRGAAWLDVSSRGRIEARGRDRARLLHNLTSNEVKKLAPGAGCYAFLLNPQGRIQADLLLFCLEDRFLLSTEPELREKARLHIQRYIIADQVELADSTEQTAELALEGPGAGAALEAIGAPAPTEDYAHSQWDGVLVARASLTGEPGFRLICPVERKPALIARLEAAGAVAAAPEDFRVARIENGRPRYGEDMSDSNLPQETQQMHAVSFSKGCYLGQEIVERIRARGHVNRKLARVELPGAEPGAPGAVVEIDGKPAEITSSVYSPRLGRAVALAYVRQ